MWQKAKNIYHLLQAAVANIQYNFPSRDMTVIGVTGTDGKTTTASMIYHILQASGKKATLISTVAAIIDGKSYDLGFHVTTPDAFRLQESFKKAKKSNAEYVVLEVTSHAIDQFRTIGINFDIAVLTNVSHEHLDYHKTYERYVATKTKLLRSAQTAIINKDDKSYSLVSSYLKNYKGEIITYGKSHDAAITPKNLTIPDIIPGEFNMYNALAAFAACQQMGIDKSDAERALATYKLPIGRMEIVYDKDFTVMIDFAHTPNAFINLLSSLKKKYKRRIIHVFGAAGKRDTSKRPEMGRASSQFTDIIVITAEDPRAEPVEKISNEIIEGISDSAFEILNAHYVADKMMIMKPDGKYIFKIADRQEAITFAINIAQKGDIVVLTGKSHEKSMNYGNGEEPWSEHEAVKKALIERRKYEN